MPIKSNWYPVNIRESRYSGAYSGGKFVLTAGARHPERLDAFGSDSDCNAFWIDHEERDPIASIETAVDDRGVYIASGDDPTELYEEFLAYFSGES